MIQAVFWIKSKLIIIIKEVNKLIKLQAKLQLNINIATNIKQYQDYD